MLRPEALPESLLLPPPPLQQGRRQQQDMIVQLKVREGGGEAKCGRRKDEKEKCWGTNRTFQD